MNEVLPHSLFFAIKCDVWWSRRCQLRWFGHFKRMPRGRLLVELSHWTGYTEADRGPAGEMGSHSWLGNIWGSLHEELNDLSAISATCQRNPTKKSGTKLNTFHDTDCSLKISTSELFCNALNVWTEPRLTQAHTGTVEHLQGKSKERALIKQHKAFMSQHRVCWCYVPDRSALLSYILYTRCTSS